MRLTGGRSTDYATVTIGGINIFTQQALNYGHIGGAGRYQPRESVLQQREFYRGSLR